MRGHVHQPELRGLRRAQVLKLRLMDPISENFKDLSSQVCVRLGPLGGPKASKLNFMDLSFQVGPPKA